MDEILIDEKKYISSKRAAKVTGYAKDYIGQLCREGRVPARLVGRSWYVLESAIHDHRFGPITHEPEYKKTVKEKDSINKLHSTWESPRYEAFTPEILPSINRLKSFSANETDTYKESENASVSPPLKEEDIQRPWKTWPDAIPEDPLTTVEDSSQEMDTEYEHEHLQLEPIHEHPIEIDDQSVNIQMRTLYELPSENLLPRQSTHSTPHLEEQVPIVDQSRESKQSDTLKFVLESVKIIAILLAIITVSVAVIGSGYLDTVLASHNRATIISGIGTYIKPSI